MNYQCQNAVNLAIVCAAARNKKTKETVESNKDIEYIKTEMFLSGFCFALVLILLGFVIKLLIDCFRD